MAESSAVFDTSAGGVDDGLRSTHILATLGFGCLLGWELSMVFAPAFPLLAFCDLRQAIFLRVASVLALALAYALSAVPAIGVVGIWWSIPIGWALADLTGVLVWRRAGRKLTENSHPGAKMR